MSGQDFRVTWATPPETESGSFSSYKVYVLPESVALNTGSMAPLETLYSFYATGTILSGALAADSSGTTFPSSGTGSYVAHVVVLKSNGLTSVASSTGGIVTADAITYPTVESAAFVSNTGIALTYSKPLSATLSNHDASKISSPSGCFVPDVSGGTAAKTVSGSTVTFAVEPLGNVGKTCSDLEISSTGAVVDSEGLYSEESFTGRTVSDSQAPSVSISSPTSGTKVGGNGSFTLAYTLPETLSGTTFSAVFTDASGSVVTASLASNASVGFQSASLTGVSVGLIDGKTYVLTLSGTDIAGNVLVSSSSTGILYDVSAPTAPALSSPSDEGYANDPTPALTWLGSTDNAASASQISYEIQISTLVDFSSLYVQGTATDGTLAFSPASNITSNTGFYWRVRSTDDAGNVSAWSSIRKFFFDDVAPTVSPSSSDTYVNNVTRSFTGYVRNGDSLDVRTLATDNYGSGLVLSGMVADLSGFGGSASAVADSFVAGIASWTFSANCSSDGTKTVAITATDLAGNPTVQNVSAVCDNTAPAISDSTLTAPASGAFVSGGSALTITWNAAHYASELSPIPNPLSLDYSTDGGTNWTPIASNEANDGTYSWTAPSADVSNAKVRLVGIDKLSNVGTGTVTFTLDSTNPSVAAGTLTFPNGGEYLKGGSGYAITWNSGNISDTNLATTPVSLDYSTDGGTNWTPIASNEANDGTYSWTAPSVDSSNVKIRITATDKVGRTASDVSDAAFVVDSTQPTLSVQTPPTPPEGAFLSMSGFDLRTLSTDTNLNRVSYSFTDGSAYWNAASSSWLGGVQWNDFCVGSAACADASETLPIPAADGGTYSLVVRASDLAGNLRDSSTFHYTGDTVAPATSVSTASGSYFSGSVSLGGTASDARSGLSSVKVAIRKTSDGTYYGGPSLGFTGTSETFLVTSTSNAYANWTYTGFSVPVGDAEGTSYEVTVL